MKYEQDWTTLKYDFGEIILKNNTLLLYYVALRVLLYILSTQGQLVLACPFN